MSSELVKELERDGQYVIVRFCGDTGEEHEISAALIEYVKERTPETEAALLAALRGGK